MTMTNKRRIFFVAICLVLLTVTVSAAVAYNLSPGLDILQNQIEMKKCGVINCDVSFTAEEFDDVLCSEVDYITITSLPDPSCGVLKVGGTDLLENQTISRKNISLLKFVPKNDMLTEASFTFKDAAEGNINAVCTIHILSDVNLAPETGDQTITTQENISAFKFLKAADPEDDAMTFQIIGYPKNGTVTLSDAARGCFSYLPNHGFTGKDSFTYTVSDIYGNQSEPQKVDVQVTKPLASIYYDDLSDHWSHNSAVRMTSLGLMGGVEEPDGIYFYPDRPVTRGDFLAMAMIVTGYEDKVALTYHTDFVDDDFIPQNIKSYAQTALDLGIISGYPTTGGVEFASDKVITRAEASVILDRLLDAPISTNAPAFTDAAAIPSWANRSVNTLASCGILNGTGYGEILSGETVSRAEAAEMLCNSMDYIESKTEKPKKNLFNLFGLLG